MRQQRALMSSILSSVGLIFLLFLCSSCVFAKLTREEDALMGTKKTKPLPDFSSGGLVFFLHIPKTGGTTIRRNIEQLIRDDEHDRHRINYVFARNFSVYWDQAHLVEEAIINNKKNHNNTILFYEIHANDAPSFFRMRKRLSRWKSTAAHHQHQQSMVPTFFFTLLRQPLDFAFSHFSFFHVQERNPSFERCQATESEFLRKSIPNPQCQFLYQGEASWRKTQQQQQKQHQELNTSSSSSAELSSVSIQPHSCYEVQDHLWKLMDWVGSTERLSNETIPLLRRLLDLPPDMPFARYKESMKMGDTFRKENVTDSATIELIRQWSVLDTAMYQEALRRYPYDKWSVEKKVNDEL